jgi:hypothetical protein
MVRKKISDPLFDSFGKAFGRAGLSESGQIAFQRGALEAMQQSATRHLGDGAQQTVQDIAAQVAQISGTNPTANTVQIKGLFAQLKANGGDDAIVDWFTVMARDMTPDGKANFRHLVANANEGGLKQLYGELGETGSEGALKLRLKDVIPEARGVDWDDWVPPPRNVADPSTMTREELQAWLSASLLARGVDPADDAAVKSWASKSLGIAKGAAIPVTTAWILIDLAHGITGASYADLLLTFFNPSRLFDTEDGGEDRPPSCSITKSASCSVTKDDGTSYTTQTECEDNDGVWDEGGEYTTKAECEDNNGVWDEGSDGSGSLLSTLGWVLIGLVGIVSLTFIMRLISMMTGR